MKKHQKTLATSLTTLVFLVVGITGVLMFFHLFDKYTKHLHEVLGLVFVAAAFFHVLFNFKAMKQYFTKKVFLVSAVVVLAVSGAFIFTSDSRAQNPRHLVVFSVLKAPLEDSMKLLGKDMASFEMAAKQKGLIYKDKNSLMELAKANKTSPFRIIQMIMEK